MEITEVKVFPVGEDKLKAYVSIIIDNCFVVRDLKIINGKNGLFVAMPSKKLKNGTFKDMAHPLNNETRDLIESKVLGQYKETVKEDPSASKKDASESTESKQPASEDA